LIDGVAGKGGRGAAHPRGAAGPASGMSSKTARWNSVKTSVTA
jgi:hypothetical protein